MQFDERTKDMLKKIEILQQKELAASIEDAEVRSHQEVAESVVASTKNRSERMKSQPPPRTETGLMHILAERQKKLEDNQRDKNNILDFSNQVIQSRIIAGSGLEVAQSEHSTSKNEVEESPRAPVLTSSDLFEEPIVQLKYPTASELDSPKHDLPVHSMTNVTNIDLVQISEKENSIVEEETPRRQKRKLVKSDSQALLQMEKVWKKALAEIFMFYNKLQKQTKGEYSFENFKEKMNYMSLGEWIKFCNDFGLNPKPQKIGFSLFEPPQDNGRTVLSNLFKKESKGSLGISYFSFEVGSG